jgi:uncharacterized protein (TIGR00251 family)
MTSNWYRVDPQRNIVTLTLHIQPNAKRTEIVGRHGDALKIKVGAAAVDGQANAKVIDFLAETFKVPVRRVTLRQGERARRKVVEIEGIDRLPDNLANY